MPCLQDSHNALVCCHCPPSVHLSTSGITSHDTLLQLCPEGIQQKGLQSTACPLCPCMETSVAITIHFGSIHKICMCGYSKIICQCGLKHAAWINPPPYEYSMRIVLYMNIIYMYILYNMHVAACSTAQTWHQYCSDPWKTFCSPSWCTPKSAVVIIKKEGRIGCQESQRTSIKLHGCAMNMSPLDFFICIKQLPHGQWAQCRLDSMLHVVSSAADTLDWL